MFYISRGIEGVCLFLLLAFFAERKLTSLQRIVLSWVVIYGAIQESLTAVCGASVYLVHGGTPTGPLLCDGPHGVSPMLVAAIVVAAAVAWIIYERVTRGRHARRTD